MSVGQMIFDQLVWRQQSEIQRLETCGDCLTRATTFRLYGIPGNTKRGKYHCTIDLLFDWFGISCMTTANFCFHLQNRLIQTSQTGGQQYSDTFSFSIPWHCVC
jgi:hypothetical protein